MYIYIMYMYMYIYVYIYTYIQICIDIWRSSATRAGSHDGVTDTVGWSRSRCFITVCNIIPESQMRSRILKPFHI